MNDRLLRFSLRGNALFSTLCAVACIADAAPLAAALRAPDAAWIAALGVGLLAFAAAVLALSLAPRIPTVPALAVVAADVLWVVATVPFLAFGAPSDAGFWLALGVAEVVMLFAVLQGLGVLRRRRPLAA